MKSIIIRADSSSLIGHGHIMRTLVLAKKYKSLGYNIIYATLNLSGNINNKILENEYKVHILNTSSIEELITFVNKYNCKKLIIDNYDISFNDEKYIKEKIDTKVLSLDDTYNKHYCDELLNHNIYAEKKKYKELVPSFCKLYCGRKYTLLRDEFYKQKDKKTKIQKNIFIAMGGSDPKNINTKIIKSLIKIINSKKIKINLITTTSNINLLKLKELEKRLKYLTLHINTKKIAELMAESSFAIVSPSVILNEIFFMEKEFIAIRSASNQKSFYKYLNKNNYKVMKKFDKIQLKKFVKELL